MKETKRILSLLLVIAMLMAACCTVLVGCDKGDKTPTEKPTSAPTEAPTSAPTEKPTEAPTDNTKITYTVNVKTAGGMALGNVMVFIYDGDNIAGYVKSDENGTGTVELVKNDNYKAVVTDIPNGYTAEESYAFAGGKADVILTSGVVVGGTMPNSYKLGDVMYDFTVTKYDDGEEVTLSKVLKEKKMALINYWYDGCVYCLQEFPEMDAVYRQYNDSVEVIALSPQDNDRDIASFMDKYAADLPEDGLTFPVAYDDQGIIARFSPSGAPTSIIVDRYGVVCLIVVGAMSEYQFRAIFDHFTADDYQQQIIEDPSILTPIEKPNNVTMPSSDEIAAILNGGDIKVTYSPETSETDAENAWPFVIGKKNGVDCIKTSNAFKHSTYAIIYATIELKAGEAVAFDYWSSSERSSDVLHVLVDREAMFQISGVGDSWETCYAYVAPKDGTYELSLCYMKDADQDDGEDTIYLKNLRVVDSSEIDKETYIFRHAANDYKADGSGYESYVSVVLGADGYYHVGTADGPILLANLMGYTRFSNEASVWNYAYNGYVVVDGVDYVGKLEEYSNYSINSKAYGYCSVTEELRFILEKVAEAVGTEVGNPNEWLQMCVYYDAYGTNGKQMEDPVKGLASFSAYEAKLNVANKVTYTQLIMPRGYFFKFIPEVDGVYRITSYSNAEGVIDGSYYDVNGWIFDSNRELIYTYEHSEKMWADTANVSMLMYMKAGETYYINIAYYDIYAIGSFTFRVENIGDTADIFTLASPGYFTMADDGDGNIDYGATPDALGVDVMLVDGKYYAVNEDGTQGGLLYADFWSLTGIFSHSIVQAIELGGFNFQKTSLDDDIEEYLAKFAEEGVDVAQGFKELWGEYLYEQRVGLIEDVKNGIYHGVGDYTDKIRAFLDDIITESENTELIGCVEMTEELAEILQIYMDTHTFNGVDHSWTKLCFYYKHYGPTVSVD